MLAAGIKNPARGGVRWQGRGGLGGLVDLVGVVSLRAQRDHFDPAKLALGL